MIFGQQRRPSPLYIPSLAAYWPLQEASGNAIDAGSNGLNLTASASNPGTTTGPGTVRLPAARSLSGSTQFFTRADTALLRANATGFGVFAWVNLSSKAADSYLMVKGNANQLEYALSYAQSLNRFYFSAHNGVATLVGEASANALGSPSTGVWYFLAGWFDSVTSKVYISVNAQAVPDEGAAAGSPGGNVAAFSIGKYGSFGSPYATAAVAGAGFVGAALTTAQVAQLYAYK